MRVTQTVKEILDWYEGDGPGVKADLARILSRVSLGATRSGAPRMLSKVVDIYLGKS